MTHAVGRTSFVILGAAFVGLGLVAPLSAQSVPIGPPVSVWQPNGTVKAMVVDGETLYAGGSFDQVGPRTGSFAVVDAAHASPIAAGAMMDVASDIVVADGSGGWFVATGRGPYVGANERGTVHHVLANGTGDPGWTPPTMPFGAAYAMIADGGRLFVSGNFASVNNEVRLGVAALDTATGAVLPWNGSVGGDGRQFHVFALALTANRLYIAGTFSSVAGAPRNRVAVLDATTGALLPGALPSALVEPTIRGIAASATRVYLEGTCQPGGTFICGYDLDLDPLPGWTFPRSGGSITAGASGVFATVAGPNPAAKRIARLDPDTGAEVTWAAVELGGGSPLGTEAEPAMLLHGGVLYLGGDFTSVNGQARHRVVAVDATTGALQAWAPLVGGRVRSLAAAPTAVALAGDFVSVGGVARRNMVALDLRSGLPRNNTPPIDMTWVNALVKLGDVMVAAGWRGFASQAPDVVAFSTSTGTPLPWSLSSDNQVYTLATDGRQLFLGGSFSSLAGQPRRNLASVDLRTGTLTSWNPAPEGLVSTLAVSGDTLFAAGWFEVISGFGRRGVAALGTNSGEVLSFNPPMPAPGVVKGFGFHADRVLLAGEPDGINRGAFRWVERGSGATASTTTLTAPGATAEGTAQVGSMIYAVSRTSGPFGLASIDSASGRISGRNSALGIGAGAVAASADYVAVGGSGGNNVFTGPFGLALAVFEGPRAGAPQHVESTVVGSTVRLRWLPGTPPVPTAYVVEAGSAAGGTDVGAFNVGLSTQVAGALAAGTYYVRVRGLGLNGEGAASSEVIATVPPTSTPPAAPGPLTASVTGGVVTLSWGAAAGNATSYVIEAGTAAGLTNVGALPTGHLDTTWSTPAPAGTYFVRVRAANAYGLSPATNEVTVVVP
jgi:hypothetical protein